MFKNQKRIILFRFSSALLYFVIAAQGMSVAASRESLKYPVQKLVDKHPVRIILNKLWDKRYDEKLLPRAVTTKERIFVGSSSGVLEAYRSADGALLWSREIAGVNAIIAADEDIVVVKFGKRLMGLSTDKGDTMWERDLDEGFLFSTMEDGSQIALLSEHGFHRLDVKSGLLEPIEEGKHSGKRAGSLFQGATAFAFDGKRSAALVFGERRVELHDIRKGKKLWSFTGGARILSAPLIWEKRVLIMGEDHFFYCLSLKKGHQIYRKKSDDRLLAGGERVLGMVLFSSFASGKLNILNLSTGTIETLFSLDSERSHFLFPPSCRKESLAAVYSDFFSESNTLIAFSVDIQEEKK